MKKVILVGGTWDEKGGKPSKIIDIIYNTLISENKKVIMYNGGYYQCLKQTQKHKPSQVATIMWFPNIPNHLDKNRSVKTTFPKAILITSKNNVDQKYSFQEIVAHGLSLKSNLILEISKWSHVYCGRLLDPLGNVWLNWTKDFVLITKATISRVKYLKSIIRKPTIWSPETQETLLPTNENKEFLKLIQKSANTFHKLIGPAEGVKRFLGNASFRCSNGFPSLITPNGHIYMSRRNIDKRALSLNQFVQVGYNISRDFTWYRGDFKPSVDTVIQVQLYKHFDKIKYMIHSHVYVADAPFTECMIPCGGLEEVHEILKTVKKHKIDTESPFALNLVGHGSIICAKVPEDFKKFEYIKRVVPEIMDYIN